MSPIGRVFIVLNLILAGGFVVFAGTNLQRQHYWKDSFTKEVAARKADNDKNASEIARLEGQVSATELDKTRLTSELGSTKNQLESTQDENKQQAQQLASFEADIKALRATAEATATESKTAFQQAQEAYRMAMADQKTKDEAVAAKNAAEAENRSLKATIAQMTETAGTKEIEIKGLNEEKSRLGLLVDVAKAKGFLESMAVPALAGVVSHVNGKLCTINVTDNPTSAEIKPGYGFAIYDASGYKGEAIVQSVDADKKFAFCRMSVVSGSVKEGDNAATKTASN
jgi:hypothetical protein